MKTIEQNHTDIVTRISHLTVQSKPRWGKISISQMLTHCIAILQVTAAHQFSPESFADQILKAISKSAAAQPHPVEEEKKQLIDCVKRQASNADLGTYQNLDCYLRQFGV